MTAPACLNYSDWTWAVPGDVDGVDFLIDGCEDCELRIFDQTDQVKFPLVWVILVKHFSQTPAHEHVTVSQEEADAVEPRMTRFLFGRHEP